MYEKFWLLKDNQSRVFLRAGRKAGVHLGMGGGQSELGTHYEGSGKDRKWFKDTNFNGYVNFLMWKVELSYVKVVPVSV